VETRDGPKRIEDIREGDYVLASDTDAGGSLGYERVVETSARIAPVLLHIHVGAEVIKVTPEHPLWVYGRGWTEACKLRPGDGLVTASGSVVAVGDITRHEGQFKVYNFEVEQAHDYFVSGLGVLVHNTCDKVDLTDAKGRNHILEGDGTGGGHGPGRGVPGKSEFPSRMSDADVFHHISDVATDPLAFREIQPNGRTRVEGTRDGIDIRVILEPNGRIVTGFPTNVPRNPK
jgi:hypothetical protein